MYHGAVRQEAVEFVQGDTDAQAMAQVRSRLTTARCSHGRKVRRSVRRGCGRAGRGRAEAGADGAGQGRQGQHQRHGHPLGLSRLAVVPLHAACRHTHPSRRSHTGPPTLAPPFSSAVSPRRTLAAPPPLLSSAPLRRSTAPRATRRGARRACDAYPWGACGACGVRGGLCARRAGLVPCRGRAVGPSCPPPPPTHPPARDAIRGNDSDGSPVRPSRRPSRP
jgi:hypothetical protein